ncbi:MAG: putative proline hydroxylase [Gemmataceae bacterium]|nr:putative proline hydroxylase [Gemmataceae bacterium]
MKNFSCGTEPVRWWVIDGAVLPVPADAIPPADSAVWEARYANDLEAGKRTTRHLDRLHGGIAGTIAALRSRASVSGWSARLGYTVEDDPALHGGGLHVTEPGGVLAVHLDYDRHPLVPGRRRALNLIAFLHPEWEPAWGGALVLCDPMGQAVKRIEPVPGRLAAFEVGDLSYHGVEPVTGPAERVTAAVYYLSPAGTQNTRRRALFMPKRS